MSEQPTFKEVLRKNRRSFLGILTLPVIGMVMSIFLIFIRALDKLALAGRVVIPDDLLVLCLVVFVSRRIDRLISS